eukprot:9275909-Karenia_brevis.AAC.1
MGNGKGGLRCTCCGKTARTYKGCKLLRGGSCQGPKQKSSRVAQKTGQPHKQVDADAAERGHKLEWPLPDMFACSRCG